MTISRQLISLIREKSVSDNDLQQAALFSLDAIANAIAGQKSEPGRILLEWGHYNHACNDNPSLDPGRRGFLLGGLTHILELDDLHRESVVHPGCIVVPAAWALVEAGRTNPDGRDVLKAILHGFEATTRVGMAVGLTHYRIFHNTATCGPYGSAMAAAALLNLDEEETVNALGNAGTQAAGLWQFLDTGAMSKHLHAGRGVEAGIVAADLALRGFTGPPEIFEGKRGFFTGLAPEGNPHSIVANPDGKWQLTQTSIKPWPCCRHTHPGIDAAQQIRAEMRDLSLDLMSISSIHVEAYQAALDVCDRPNPETVYDAKFSLHHCIAAGLTRDQVDFSSFEEPARNTLQSLRQKTTLSTDPAISAAYPDHWGTNIHVNFSNGHKISVMKHDAKGDPEAPLSRDEMIAKARQLLEYGAFADPDRLIDEILDMANGGRLPQLSI